MATLESSMVIPGVTSNTCEEAVSTFSFPVYYYSIQFLKNCKSSDHFYSHIFKKPVCSDAWAWQSICNNISTTGYLTTSFLSPGARFINLQISSLVDKWYGESQKRAEAVFSLVRFSKMFKILSLFLFFYFMSVLVKEEISNNIFMKLDKKFIQYVLSFLKYCNWWKNP